MAREGGADGNGPRNSLARLILATSVGSALEWYDYFIYGTAAALVFGDLFFPTLDPASATLAAFASFGVGFVARPFGGLVFGHYGDRLGRKPVLVLTLALVGGGTVLVGLLPTYDSIGIWAPVLLVLLRLLQGFGSGAEYAGAAIFAVESAPPHRRGLYGSFAPMGVTVGNILALVVFAALSLLDRQQLLEWGWRLPFLASAVLVALSLHIRTRLVETFATATETPAHSTPPALEAIRHHKRSVLLVLGARMAENGLAYLFPVFGLSYMANTLGVPRGEVLASIAFGLVVETAAIAGAATLSDRIGRRPVYLGAALLSAAFAFPFFWLIDTRSPPLIFLATALSIGIGTGGMYGPQAAYFAELFPPRVRFSGFAFVRELGSVLAGGPAPFVAALLVTGAGGAPWGVAGYVVVLSLLTSLTLYLGPETRRVIDQPS